MVKWILIVVGLSIISGFFIYSQFFESESANDTPFRLAIVPWITDGFFLVAEEKGFFEKNNVQVEITVIDYDYTDILSQYGNNEFDVFNPIFTDIFMLNSIYDQSSIVYVTDVSSEGDFIVSNFDSMEKLKGKKIGIAERYGYSYFLVLKILETYGIDEKDVEFVVTPPEFVLDALKNGEIDAGYSYIAAHRTDPDVNVVAYASDASGVIATLASTITFKTQTIEERPLEVEAIVRSYVESVEYCKTNVAECGKIISNIFKWSEEDFLLNLESTQILTLEDNYEIMQNRTNSESMYVSAKFVAEKLIELEQIHTMPNLDIIIDPQFVIKLINKRS